MLLVSVNSCNYLLVWNTVKTVYTYCLSHLETSVKMYLLLVKITADSLTDLTQCVISRDDLSGVRLVELGVGLTVSDIAILPWTPIFLNVTATITHKINVADGMRAFIRIRATNNGKYYYTY